MLVAGQLHAFVIVGDSREVLAACGNMSSPTILFILDRLRRTGVAGPCLALGFGPGLVAEAALLDLMHDVLSPN